MFNGFLTSTFEFGPGLTIDLLAVKCMMGKFSLSAGRNGILNQLQWQNAQKK